MLTGTRDAHVYVTIVMAMMAMAAGAQSAAADTHDSGVKPAIMTSSVNLSHDADYSSSTIRPVVQRYQTDREALDRYYNVPMSVARVARLQQFLESWRDALDGIDFEALGRDGRIDYLLLRNELTHELKQLAYDAKRDAELADLLPFARQIVQLDENRSRLVTMNAEAAAQTLSNVVEQIKQVRRAVAAGLDEDADGQDESIALEPVIAYRAARRTRQLRSALEQWYGFYNEFDPLFTWWTQKPYTQANEALKDYAVYLGEALRGEAAGTGDADQTSEDDAIVGDPIGRDALLDDLAYEMIPYTPQQLIVIAQDQFAWCEAEMLKASRELGFGDDWRKALEHVKDQHVPPGEQPQLVRDLAHESAAFLEQHDLITIPPLAREIWRMRMLSPQQQKVNPYMTGGEVISFAYAAESMTHEQKLMSMRGNNIHFSRAVVHHEAIPGHHLQGFMSRRHRAHRRPFRTAFLTEGWAVYWEMLLWDMDFPRSPADRIGMLFWRMHRCARIIVSLKFHLELMTPQQMIDFIIERVGHEKDGAEGEVRRFLAGNYGPLYQCAYMLGALQLRALHKELVQSGKMTNRQFHDSVMRENAIPIELIRASLIQQELTRDFVTQWKFQGDISAD